VISLVDGVQITLFQVCRPQRWPADLEDRQEVVVVAEVERQVRLHVLVPLRLIGQSTSRLPRRVQPMVLDRGRYFPLERVHDLA